MHLKKYKRITGFITNFEADDLPKYEAAIEAYKTVAPNVKLVIGPGWLDYKQALYCKSSTPDLSGFWRIFDQ